MTQKIYAARSKSIAARKLGNEMMIMSGRDSTLFTLDEVATVLWEAMDGITSLDQIVDEKICKEFDVAPEDALRDAEALAEGLAQHGILMLSNEPITGQGLSQTNLPQQVQR